MNYSDDPTGENIVDEQETAGAVQEKIIQIIPAQPGWRVLARNGDTVSEEPVVCWALVEQNLNVPRPESCFNRSPEASFNKLTRSQRCPRRYVKAVYGVGNRIQLDESGGPVMRYLAPDECVEPKVD